MKVEKTTAYGQFKFLKKNREINEDHFERIRKSLEVRNLLEFRPILVDEEYNVLDGQHRLEAARRMGIPIYYQVSEKHPAETIYILNSNQQNWTIQSYLNYHSNDGVEDYVQFSTFIETHHISIATGLALLSTHKLSQGRVLFKQGKFTPGEGRMERAEEILHQVEEVKMFIRNRSTRKTLFVDNERFKTTLILFLLKPGVDFKIFMKKLEYKLDYIRPCTNGEEFMRIFVAVYNYNNKNPIEGRFEPEDME